LKPDFTFATKLFETASGDLVLVGSGDPSLRQKDFEGFVAAVKSRGRISDDFYYDDSIFIGEKFGPGWGQDWKDQYFAVPITGLQINDNLFDIVGRKNEKTGKFEITTAPLENYAPLIDKRNSLDDPNKLEKPITAVMNENGSVMLRGDTLPELPFRTSSTVKDPSLMTALTLKQELVKAGLMKQSAKVLPWKRGTEYGALLYEHRSKPLKDLVFDMLKFSKNNYAETLVRTLGKEKGGEGSQKKGVEILREFFDEIGIPEYEMTALDGSGLSPETRVTGHAILLLFDYVNTQPWAQIFWQALPESQVDGTLKYRFENTGLKHTVIGKTGTHGGASSLSGKILRQASGGKNILFSVHIFNHPFSTEESIFYIVPIIDKIIALLDKQF
jgi:PBP4 family serine-type D-alanyl-D-alanine carboxypeptidase